MKDTFPGLISVERYPTIMKRGKSAGATPGTTSSTDEMRKMCKRVSPYIVHCWREVCEELGVADADIEGLERTAAGSRLSEVAFRGLCCWLDMVGRTASKEKLMRVFQMCGLRRAEDELRSIGQGRHVPYLGRPATAVPRQDTGMNKQARQKAFADRLSRPKAASADNQPQTQAKTKKQVVANVAPGINPLTLQVAPSKESDICEVKVKINVKGVRRTSDGEMESTKDDFCSTKDDFKHTCHTFLRLAMSNQKTHFKELKTLLGFNGISVQRLDKMGFNINLFILCFNLGAFEVLFQSYSSGRLKHIVQSALVTEEYLKKLNAHYIELSVVIDEGMVNKYRDILVVRSASASAECHHPIDMIDVPESEEEEEKADKKRDSPVSNVTEFNLELWTQDLSTDIEVLHERFEKLSESSNELLIILRIAKPQGLQVVESLKDIVDIYQNLRNGKSYSNDSRIRLLAEYLYIVNQIRLKTSYIRDHDLQISFDENLSPEACEQYHIELTNVEEMLLPDYRFKPEEKLLAHVLSLEEKVTYGGMFTHIPILLQKLQETRKLLSGCLQKDENQDDIDLKTKPEPEVTVDENANITDKTNSLNISSFESQKGISADKL